MARVRVRVRVRLRVRSCMEYDTSCGADTRPKSPPSRGDACVRVRVVRVRVRVRVGVGFRGWG